MDSMNYDADELINEAMRLYAAGSVDSALATASRALTKGAKATAFSKVEQFLTTGEFSKSSWPTVRIAFLGSYTLRPVIAGARCAMLMNGSLLEAYEAPFDSLQQEILNPDSGLYSFGADAIVIAIGVSGIVNLPVAPVSDGTAELALEQEVGRWIMLWQSLEVRLGKPVLQHVIECPPEEFLGLSERQSAWTPYAFVRVLNQRLIGAAPSLLTWVDVDRLAERIGRLNWHDARLQYYGKFGFSPRFVPEYAASFGAAWRTAVGRARKALVVDLDNTLWGGIIGDDGVDGIRLGPGTAEGEAYQAFCRYIKGLGQRGVILGVCSKNDFNIVAEAFEKHPHMPLKLSDFAVVYCNWEDKASNLSRIAQELNVDVSSLVFVDDNPAECELIRQFLPEIFTLQMDGDPALFVRKLDSLHLFHNQVFSQEDFKRSESYQAKAKSIALQAQAPNLDAYLVSLEMKAIVKIAEPVEFPRLAQMEMKTNQFNLTTRRLSLEQLESMFASSNTLIFSIFLADRFADHGLVSYIALEIVSDKIIITDWLMSCRVFSRTLEQFVFNHLVNLAIEKSIKSIEIRFKPTAKNKVMETLFERFGFSCIASPPEGPWRFVVAHDWTPLQCFISSVPTSTALNNEAVRD